MKLIPNFLSIFRAIFSLILFFTRPFCVAFYIIYLLCGLSDVMDGFIAIKTGTASSFGAKLDSIADMIMIVLLLIILCPLVNITKAIILWIVVIFIIRLAAVTAALKKYKTFASIHTYGNKITGLVLFVSPILLPFIHATLLIYTVCVIASLSAIEELAIQLTSKELQLNLKSIFIKKSEGPSGPSHI